ncbi:MAG TPA: hypothetical protein VF380_09665, partial [Solirubrobacteraceae bacterium]
GAAWVFARVAGIWVQAGPKLTGGGEVAPGQFGMAVSLSGDGNSALIGGPADNGATGAVWAFSRSGGVWSQQGSKLTGGEEVGEGMFGQSVGLSADGNTAIFGGYRDGASGHGGAAWIFTRSEGTWTQHGPKLTGGGNSFFGYSVALAPSGTVALVGGPRDHGKQGAVWEFVNSGGEWVSAGSKLLGMEDTTEIPSETPEEIEEGAFGRSLALSADGSEALIGAPRDLSLAGAVWVFVQPAPMVVTTGATNINESAATLHGLVNAEGRELTECKFEYGTTSFEEASAPCVAAPASISKLSAVTANVSGLQGHTAYKFRLRAANLAGFALGGESTFATQRPEETTGEPPLTPAAKGGVSGFSQSGGGSSTGTTSTGASCTVALVSRAATVPGGRRVAVRLRASGGFTGACKGRLKLTVKVRAGGHVKTRTIAAGSFSLAAARTRWVRLTLNGYGRTLLAGNTAKVSALLSIVKLTPGPARARFGTVRIPAHRH